MTIVERIDIFRKSRNITQKEFCTVINYKESSLSTSLKRKSDIQSTLLLRIAEAYEDLNLEWLVTGKGSMLRTGPDQSQELKDCIKKKEQLSDLLIEKELEIKRLKGSDKNANKSKLKT